MSSYFTQFIPTISSIEDLNNWTLRKVKDVADYITPLIDTSSNNFMETGQLSTEEFILTGDQLVYSCPTWRWMGTNNQSNITSVSYLPLDKQFLLTKNIPSYKRVENMSSINDMNEEDNWSVMTYQPSEIQELYLDENDTQTANINIEEYLKDNKKCHTNEECDLLENLESDPHNYNPYFSIYEEKEHILKTWTYDISITYDKYYRTPRIYLFGYNEFHEPLSFHQIMQDISTEHANKTVTFDPHPNLGVNCVSIHPCLHANTMKKIFQFQQEKSTVHSYLFLFIKFISTIMPTIEYDFTI